MVQFSFQFLNRGYLINYTIHKFTKFTTSIDAFEYSTSKTKGHGDTKDAVLNDTAKDDFKTIIIQNNLRINQAEYKS